MHRKCASPWEHAPTRPHAAPARQGRTENYETGRGEERCLPEWPKKLPRSREHRQRKGTQRSKAQSGCLSEDGRGSGWGRRGRASADDVKSGPFKSSSVPDQSAQILDSAQSAGRVWRRAVGSEKALAPKASQPSNLGTMAHWLEGLNSSFGRSSTHRLPPLPSGSSHLACEQFRTRLRGSPAQIGSPRWPGGAQLHDPGPHVHT